MRHSRAIRRRNLVAALAMAAAVLSGCTVDGLSFVQDDRVEIISPEENAEVRLPLEIRWKADDVHGRFAVFVDRSPMKPNQTLESLVAENDPCRATPGCPDAEWLADHDVYVTDRTELVLEALADRRNNNREKDRHEVIIVILDETGRRQGESAFITEFIVKRES